MSKYRAVLKRYGRSGFGVPAKAPNVGSFPLYPIGRAQYALVLIAAPSYDKKKTQRAQIAKRALAAHPSLKSFWAARKRTISARMEGRDTPRLAANPSGQKQIALMAKRRSELAELVPAATDALMEMGADTVEVSSVRQVPVGDAFYGGTAYSVRFTIEGLGTGRRFSSTQRRTFREMVTAFLPSRVGAPSFRNATGDGFEATKGEPSSGYRRRGKTPDSKRTARAKAKSRARRVSR
ncbi:hypothetical protein K0U83_03850 [bacterium]|nr:hypothetical protein [bacterium]